jgi:hypothetical protein
MSSDDDKRDFQTAPFEELCGCIAVDIPSHLLYRFDKPNKKLAEELIRRGEGKRIVLANCSKCGGTGLLSKA